MKVLKSLFLCVGTVLLALNFTACTDWGDADPEAGNQTYPDRSVVSTYTFDYGADDVYFLLKALGLDFFLQLFNNLLAVGGSTACTSADQHV